ncbi:hypothetical protein BC937DRAFT_93080 [Endogone sp. FLAS-F59071]|nr:hypothetical protein BC937DRAFT_93080 [Endogone sp. FLAS-F59071]|eukprot:RUS23038.1 hypothetical protein BC937DRAFT_93080 [Endogone sp. FLAS-F59071]
MADATALSAEVHNQLNAEIDKNSGTTTHKFNPDAPPEEKAAQAMATMPPGILPNDRKPTGGIATDLGTHDANEVAKALNKVQKKPVITTGTTDDKRLSTASTAMDTPKSASPPLENAPKVPGSYPVHPGGKLPEWYKVGWTAFAGLPLKTSGLDDDEAAAQVNARQETDMLADFLSEAYYGEWWHNAGAFIIAVIFTWIIAKFGGGLGACLVIGAFLATYYQTSIRRLRRNVRDDLQREVAKVRLETEEESADWINTFLSRFWLIYEPVLSSSIIQSVDQVLADSTPAFLDSIRLTTFTLGTKPPRIDSVKTFPKTEPDVVVMDWKFSFTPNDILDLTRRELQNKVNPKIVLTIRVGKGFVGAGMPILLEDMAFSGNIQLRFKLMSQFPHVKTVEASFLSEPIFDFVLKPIGGDTLGFDITHIPGLAPFIREQVHATLRPMMYAPNVFSVDVDAMMNGNAQSESAIGVLAVTVYSASGLRNSDLIGTCDPYVKFHINNRPELGRTSVKEDTTDPKWSETHFLLLNTLNEILSSEIMDKNTSRKDKSMGIANFDLKSIADGETIQEGLALSILRNGKAIGELKLDMRYFPVSQPKKLEDGTIEPAAESNTGIMRFTIHGCQDLDPSKSMIGQYNPYAALLVNGSEKWKTKSIKRTNNPTWEKSFEMLIVDKSQANLAVKIKDEREFSEHPTVGSWNMSLFDLLDNLEKKRDWFQLKDCSSGKIHLSAVWKPVIMTGVGEDMGHGVYTEPIGVVRFKLHGARDLKNVEAVTGGKSDPYVRIMSGVQIRARTEVIESNLNPNWNEVHYVPVHSIRETLVLEVLDWNQVAKDKSLGATELDIRKLVKEVKEGEGPTQKVLYEGLEAIDKQGPLYSTNGKSAKGELHYEASFFPTLRLAKEETQKEITDKDDKASTSAIGAQDENGIQQLPSVDIRGEALKTTPDGYIDYTAYEAGVLAVTIHEAKFDRRISAFAEILLDSNDAQFKTIQGKGTQIEYAETADAFVKELDFSRLVVRFRQPGELGKEPGYAGGCSLKVKDLVRQYKGQVEALKKGQSTTSDQGQWYQLQNSDTSGQVRLSFKYTPVTNFKLDPSESMENQGILKVVLLKASNLMAADRGGTSDPYVVFSLNGEKVHKTEPIKKTLNPVFTDEHFDIPVPSRTTADLRFEIFDWNQIQQAKPLGGGIIPLTGENVVSFSPVEKEIQVTGVPGATGTLHSRLIWQPELLSRKKTSTMLGGAIGGATRVFTSAPGAVIGAVGGGAHLAGEGVQLGGKVIGNGARMAGGVLSSGMGLLSGNKKKKDGNGSFDTLPIVENNSSAQPNVPEPQQSAPISSEQSGAPLAPITTQESATNSSDEDKPRVSIDAGAIRSSVSEETAGNTGSLTITFIEAKGLKAVDRGGTSDPFVRLRIGKKEVYKTNHIKKTLTPTWNESFTTNASVSSTILDFNVKDHNTFGGDVDLGECELNLRDVLHHVDGQTSSIEKWLTLSNGGGELHVKLEFAPGEEADENGGKHRLSRGFTALKKKVSAIEPTL